MYIWKGATDTHVKNANPASVDQWLSFSITNVSNVSAIINITIDGVHVAEKDYVLAPDKTWEVKSVAFPMHTSYKVDTDQLMDYYIAAYLPSESAHIDTHNVIVNVENTIEGGGGGGGSSGTLINTYPAGENLGGNRLVVLIEDELFYFNPADETHYNYIVGFTSAAGLISEDIDVVSFGPLTGFSLVAGETYYAAANGTITNVVPTSGTLVKVGTAVDASILFINIYQPVILS